MLFRWFATEKTTIRVRRVLESRRHAAAVIALCVVVTPLATPASVSGAEPANLVVTGIGAVTAREGDLVTFSATIKNIGGEPTPSGISHGIRFSVDGFPKTWSDSSNASLGPGASRTLTADSGPKGFSTWAALEGRHTLEAWVDDVNRVAEGNEADNKRTLPFEVAMVPRVFAHWHHSTQRNTAGANTVAAYQEEIRKAKAMGIDAFAYNVIMNPANVAVETPEIENLFTAARLEGNFFLFPEADICCVPRTDATGRLYTPAESDDLLAGMLMNLASFKYDDPVRLRVDGGRYGNNLPMMQTWHGQDPQKWGGQGLGQTYWKARQDEWKAAGRPQFFIPYFARPAPTGVAEVEPLFNAWDGSSAGQADDLVDGINNFSGWASLTNPHQATELNKAYGDAARARPGMDAMFGCAPVFNRHSGPDVAKDENRIIGDFEGFTTWISCLKGLVAEKPRFISFSTWNDYLEGSYLGGPYSREALWPNNRGNEFSHDAFREIGKYYLEWYKTGRQPDNTTDLIAIAHRPHPVCAPGPEPGTDGSATCAAAKNDQDKAEHRPGTPESTRVRPLVRQVDAMEGCDNVGGCVVDDKLYAAVILKSPGRVTLTSGATTKSFDLPAGVQQVSMPFALGTQSIGLERSGAPVASATSAVQIVGNPNVFNYNVATAHARSTVDSPPGPRSGYWMLGSTGSVYGFGEAAELGEPTGIAAANIAQTSTGNGYWIVSRTGAVHAYGDAKSFGDLPSLRPGETVSSLSPTPTGQGYWLFTNQGRALPYGPASFFGDVGAVALDGPILGSVSTPSGNGYYMVAADGGIFAFGDAAFAGSMGGQLLNGPVVGLAPDPDGSGYWLVASDGGIFAFSADFRGSMGGIPLNKPMVGMVAYGDGYLMVASDGGIFNYSSRPFRGSLPPNTPPNPIIAVAPLTR